jgi:hypothetical protein
METFVPRCTDYSDDGVTWRGAYGPRLYRNGQLQSVVDRLKRDPNTRQATLTIMDPSLDTDSMIKANTGKETTKDHICNTTLYFSIKNNRLNLTLCNRSNDLFWGLCNINIPEFTVIQSIVAEMVGVEVGKYYVFSNDLHIYTGNPIVSKQIESIRTEYSNNFLIGNPVSETYKLGLINKDSNCKDISSMFRNIIYLGTIGNNYHEIIDKLEELYTLDGELGLMVKLSIWYFQKENRVDDNEGYSDTLKEVLKELISEAKDVNENLAAAIEMSKFNVVS